MDLIQFIFSMLSTEQHNICVSHKYKILSTTHVFILFLIFDKTRKEKKEIENSITHLLAKFKINPVKYS